MKIIKVVKTLKDLGDPVKVYAIVQSRTRKTVRHLIVYVRNKKIRGWFCSCENFMYDQLAKNRNCDHIREIRNRFGRFGQKVGA